MAVDFTAATVAIRLLSEYHPQGKARLYLDAMPDEAATSLYGCLRRLGWWFPIEDERTTKERLEWWLFRDDVMKLEVIDEAEHRRIETPDERLRDALQSVISLSIAAFVPSGSCLSVARYVRNVAKVNHDLPLAAYSRRLGWPHHDTIQGFVNRMDDAEWLENAQFREFCVRFDGECLDAAFADVATKLGLPPLRLRLHDSSGHPFSSEQRALDDVRKWLKAWLRDIESAVKDKKELPPGWEPWGNSNLPASPILNTEHLRDWLSSWLKGVHESRIGSWISAESYLDDIQRELRNARRAMREWKQPLPIDFNAKPVDIHEAEEQLMLLIDGLIPLDGDASTPTVAPVADAVPTKEIEANNKTATPHFLGLLHQANEWAWCAAKAPPITEVDFFKLGTSADYPGGALDYERACERAMVEAYQKDFDTITDRLLAGFRERGLELSERIRHPSFQTSAVGIKAEAAKMISILSSCCQSLKEKAFENGELPKGWEPDAEFNFPAKPIRNIGELSEYLDFVLDIVREQLSERTYDEELLGDVQRELRNAREAMWTWGNALSPGFNDKPPDIHDAKRQLELLLDWLANCSKPSPPDIDQMPGESCELPGVCQEDNPAGGDDAGDEQVKGKKKRRRKKSQFRRNSEELVKSALKKHHEYQTGGSVMNFVPATTRQIEELTEKGVSDSTALRVLIRHFGSIAQYQEACTSGNIGPKLVILLGDGLHAFGSIDTTTNDVESDSDE